MGLKGVPLTSCGCVPDFSYPAGPRTHCPAEQLEQLLNC